MKGSGVTNLVIGVLFIILIASAALSYKFYKECIDKIDLAAKQTKVLSEKINDFEMNIDNIKVNLETLKSEMQAALAKSGQSEELKNEVFTKIDAIKKDLQDMQVGYAAALNEINTKINDLKKGLDLSQKPAEKKPDESKVDLGEISVQKTN